MKKQKLLLFIPLFIIMLALCGCDNRSSVTVMFGHDNVSDRALVLLQPQEGDVIVDAQDEDLRGSAVHRYDTGGWVIAERIDSLNTHSTKNGAYIDFLDKKELVEFCEKYKSMKIAYCDESWKPVKISGEIQLVCKKKYAVVSGIQYNPEYNDYIVTERTERLYPGGHTAGSFLLDLSVLAWLVGGGLIVAMIVFAAKKPPAGKGITLIVFFAMSLPSAANVTVYLLRYISPYFNYDDSVFEIWDIVLMAVMNAPWFIALVLLIIALVNKKRYENAPPAPAQGYPQYQQAPGYPVQPQNGQYMDHQQPSQPVQPQYPQPPQYPQQPPQDGSYPPNGQ